MPESSVDIGEITEGVGESTEVFNRHCPRGSRRLFDRGVCAAHTVSVAGHTVSVAGCLDNGLGTLRLRR